MSLTIHWNPAMTQLWTNSNYWWWNSDLSKSISSGAKYVTLQKKISHPSSVMYSFATPQIKLKLGEQIGGGLLITNHLDQSLWWANQKHWAAVRSYLLHSFFCMCIALLTFLWTTATCAIMMSQNYFPESNRHMLEFLHPILVCRSHTEHHWRCSKKLILDCVWLFGNVNRKWIVESI
jgi:hypothetical protein